MSLNSKVLKKAKNINCRLYPKNRIDALIDNVRDNYNDEDLITLLALVYVLCKVEQKINETLCNSNTNYLSIDDLFQIFITETWEKAVNYDKTIGNFIGRMSRYLDYAFIDACKNSFFKVTGNPERKDLKVSTFNVFKDTVGYQQNLDKDKMDREIHEQVNNLPEGYRTYINYKFFSGTKNPISDSKCAKKLGLTLNQVSYMKKTAYALLYVNGIVTQKQYAESMDSDNKIEFYTVDVDKFFKKMTSVKTNFSSRYTWREVNEYYE